MPARARRSCLTVPATSERMLEKARSLPADEIVIDLEDAVAPADKTDETRQRVVKAALATNWRAPTLAVRVNPPGSQWFRDDLEQVVGVAGGAIDCIVLPKVESADDVAALAEVLQNHDASIGLEVQIETARGMVEVERIASASPRVEALVFGPADYAAALGIPQPDIGGINPAYPGDQWHYPRSRIAVAAHANGLDAIDGPFASLHDLNGLRESAVRAQLLGFTGKWVIHPKQIEVCNEVFAPSPDEVTRAARVVEALEEANRGGAGAASVDGMMVDEASRKLAEAILARRQEG